MSTTKWLPAGRIELAGRFDIVAKYNYAKAFADNALSDAHRRAYEEHIRTLNAFFEYRDQGDPKVGASDFVHDFNVLLASIRDHGFDPTFPVTVDSARRPLDGAHRVAASLAFDRKIAVRQTERSFPGKWHYRFFRERGMSPEQLDFAATGLGELYDGLRAVVVYGSALIHAEALIERLSTAGEIVYSTRVTLSTSGCENLIRILYDGERWLGRREFGYLGASSKARLCFPIGSPQAALILWLRPQVSPGEIVETKERAREVVGLGKHSLHVTDNVDETLRLSDWVLNANARHLLNNRHYRYLPGFERDFADLKRRLAQAPREREHLCIVGSSVMAVYGIRDSRDLDIIDGQERSRPDDKITAIGLANSNAHLRQFGFDIRSLLYDPANYFRYKGIKCVSLANVAKLKTLRGEAKDQIDGALIHDVLPRPNGISKRLARAALLLRLYSNAKFLRSYAGHWVARIKNRVRS